mmetsp:Transcript_45361/g.142239  ORF Transcript_45361/g.142239 Transcript_45361/m.142239 type:complete len:124 (-) Transcript_45361:210-581(-)|eukprot:CAMPEP_0118862988 /NCGR_PEP_ID=MMETSP1163-20130328/8022_1 /TAXON_ID=124430 /ORGANISM="Phaeomonas parva, Strain CCMP2877" /LENGTH=123 /DNA_ID=CAMNT_0006796951 /DNA_START=78 /DNA_END=449 /DNA_ORIENTATION=+
MGALQATQARGAAASAAGKGTVATMIAETPALVLSKSYCPYCRQAKSVLSDMGADYKIVELDEVKGGSGMQREMSSIIGRSSVPAVFVGGKYIGGANDGGMGGVLPLARAGKLQKMLKEAGAL